MTLKHRKRFTLIYILHMIILNLMIMFLMMTQSVIMMLINPICLITKNTNHQKRMLIIVITLDQNLIPKMYLKDHGRQNFSHSTTFLNY